MRNLFGVGIALIALVLTSTGSVFGQGALRPDGLPENDNQRYLLLRKRLPTAEVNGTIITHEQVENRMRTLRRSDVFSTYREYEDMKPAAFRILARDLIIDEVVALQEARKRGIGLVEGEAEAIADRFLPNDTEEAKMKMEQHGLLDRGMLLDRSARNAVIDKLRSQIAADSPRPTTEEMRAFYEANSKVFEVTSEMVLARHIMILKPQEVKVGTPEYEELQERLDRLIDRLKNGDDFAELADRNTEDPKGIGKGGSLGWVKRGDFPTEMEKTLFNQRVGAIPDRAFRTTGGFNILLIEDKKPPVLQPFEEAIPRIERGMQIEYFKQWLSEQRKNSEIFYFEELPLKGVLEGEAPKKTDRKY